MEAFDFIDADVLWFIGLGILFLASYWTWKIVREYKGMDAEEPPVLTDAVKPYPLPTEPVGMSTAEFEAEDKKEVEVVKEVVADTIPYPTPQPAVTVTVTPPPPAGAAFYPLPVFPPNVAEGVSSRTLEGPFLSHADLVEYLHITGCQAAVNFDGVIVQGGNAPALEYQTVNGLIYRKQT